MAVDPLEKLLRDVDAIAGTGPMRNEQLPGRIRQLARRRRRRNIAFGGVAAVVLVVALAVVRLPERRDSAPIIPPIADNAELWRIQVEIARHESQLASLLAKERSTAAAERLRKIGPAAAGNEWVRQQLDFGAITVLAGAEVKLERFALTESAAADYRRVAKTYPDTIWAETAAMRLAAIGRELPEELEP